LAEHGSRWCRNHCGVSTENAESVRSYLLTQAQDRNRLAQLTDYGQLSSLREEIALTKILIEKRWNLIKTDNDLLTSCGSLNQLMLTMERLVKSAHAIEQDLGVLLAKPAVHRLGQQICQIIIEELEGLPEYENLADRISQRIVGAVATTTNQMTESQQKLLS
jgi:hypothetical protein